jgi:hypothetical protein
MPYRIPSNSSQMRRMKSRIIFGIAMLLAILLCAKFSPLLFGTCRNGHALSPVGAKSTSLKSRSEIAVSDLRTAASALRYLLEPEPDQPYSLTVVSNSGVRRLAGTNLTPLTLASNAAVQNLARSNASASPWLLGSNVAHPRILGPFLSDPQAEPQPATARPTCSSRTWLAG